jgi:hypothetical protein
MAKLGLKSVIILLKKANRKSWRHRSISTKKRRNKLETAVSAQAKKDASAQRRRQLSKHQRRKLAKAALKAAKRRNVLNKAKQLAKEMAAGGGGNGVAERRISGNESHGVAKTAAKRNGGYLKAAKTAELIGLAASASGIAGEIIAIGEEKRLIEIIAWLKTARKRWQRVAAIGGIIVSA